MVDLRVLEMARVAGAALVAAAVLGSGTAAGRPGKRGSAALVRHRLASRNNSGWVGRLDTQMDKLRVTFLTGDPPSAVAAGPAGVWVIGGNAQVRRPWARVRRGRAASRHDLAQRRGDANAAARRL
jgi:hypothetical protein